MTARRLAHADRAGRLQMVDISAKAETNREAVATGQVRMSREALDAIVANVTAKGDVLTTARLAGIQAAKRCSDLIPLCHSLPLTLVDVACEPDGALPGIRIEARVRCRARTGAEMEALTAVAVCGLTVIDMAKSVDRWMTIEGVQLLAKSGGKSGDLRRPSARHRSSAGP